MKTTYKLILKDGSVLMSNLSKKVAEKEKEEYEWRIEGSNDGVTFTDLTGTQNTEIASTGITLDFINSTSYLYYRMFVLTGRGPDPGLRTLRFSGETYAFTGGFTV